MTITPSRAAVVLIAVAAVALAFALAPRQPLVWIGSVVLLVGVAALLRSRIGDDARFEESERIEQLSLQRRAELVRGTSLRLREMRYRYSVRHDERGRMPFSARINQIRLGFVPVILTDNENDRQGLGFVAFIHDGHRWRGPGLPCAGERDQAIEYAARHIDPLRAVEDTGDTQAGRSADTSIEPDGASWSDDGSDSDDEDSRWDTGSGWDDDSEPGDGGART